MKIAYVRFHMQKLCLTQFDLSYWSSWYQVDSMSTSITHRCGVSHMWTFKKVLEGPKPYHYSGVEAWKKLALNIYGYQAMLNTWLQWKEWDPLLLYCLFFWSREYGSGILEKNKWSRRHCSNHISHKVDDNSIVSVGFFVFSFHNWEEKNKA